MFIVGLQRGHDVNATIIIDGKLQVIAEAERVNGDKHAEGLPMSSVAIAAALREAGAKPGDVDAMVVTDSHNDQFEKNIPETLSFHRGVRGMPYAGKVCEYRRWMADIGLEGLRADVPLYGLCHHLSHAIGAHFLSGFETANALIADGYGPCCSTAAYHMRGRETKRLEAWTDKFLLGVRYQLFGHFIREIDKAKTSVLDLAGKIMGLQAYGTPIPEYTAKFKEWFYKDHADYWIAYEQMFDKVIRNFADILGPPGLQRNSTHARDPYFLNALASMQAAFTEIMAEAAIALREETGEKKLVLSGGCALNVVSNTEIARLFAAEDLYIPPNASDCGQSVGAAVMGSMLLDTQHDPFTATPVSVRRNPYMGLSFARGAMESDWPNTCLKAQRPANAAITALELYENIQRGAVIGMVQGRCEIGPRALGHRSIIANPALPDMKDVLNTKIKYREWWRPFAPVARAVDAARYFDIIRPCPYMLYSAYVKPAWRAKLPAITHVDGSARLQILEQRENHPLLWDLLTLMEKRTGCGVLLNTSFNLGGSPLVNRWDEVKKMLDSTLMDAAWVEGVLFYKPNNYQLRIF